nr:isoleucine--tRNA ligase, cytoplasmic isoform X2 [Parasteatoda tepidariorum]XP_042904276.1 isoleucine--tRNA ligase, cytoplasmic isoform X2 [Parasteatoda tepidariorum]
MAEAVPEYIDFPKEEEKILQFWKSIDAFKNCLKQSKGKPKYTFYDGPPFATGLPHYGHLLAGTIKDIVTRVAHQSGFHVDRRFGWDCHGLPVEYEIDKTLDIKGPKDVEKLGIANYNNECRKIVMRYAKEWEEIVGRMGRWIDFENDYKTLYPSFMESVWYTFKQLYNKGFVYRGVKVMPFSTACSTPLSNFESGQNYKEVVDPAVIVNFPLDKSPDVSIIAWTTTPWTLPSNLSVCVHPDLDYVKLKDNATGKLYIMMEARLEALYKKPEDYTILERFKGRTLEGNTYDPLFPYFKHLKAKGAFRVVCDTYVTEESGTGVVHQAPYFGEDDYRICLKYGIITKDQEIICPLDFSGKFVDPVTDFKDQYVKDADKNIVKYLKSKGRLVHQSTTKHSYPFCWRSDTPLIYRAVPSWFIRVEHMTETLLKANKETYWVPDFVKEKRFANWLRDARDWAVSRNRYWGTPIPLWVSDDGEEIVCVGSIEELEQLTNTKVTDLHREHVDQLTIPSSRGKGVLKRVTEVFDCWFESGSMPYAQVHYPFENAKEFNDIFPADFIAEGVDQTRGWFYTLLVISTALHGKAPFKNLIVNGLVLASDGQKMSKRKKNYPDPMDVVNKFGADSLRLYLINSPVVRAETLRFKEEGVRDVLKDVFLPWYNSYRFLVQNIHMYEKNWDTKFIYSEDSYNEKNYQDKTQNIMDCWILSFTQSLVDFVKKEMKAYRLYTVVPRLVKFVDHLTNWYVRMNRRRLKGDGGETDCKIALETLFLVLYTMIRMMAPFTPFFTELMYQNLQKVLADYEKSDKQKSIHYLYLPDTKDHLINVVVERKVARMQEVIDIGRLIRERNTLPIKYPLSELVVIHESKEYLEDVKSLEKFIVEELNIKTLTITTEKQSYGVQVKAEPDTKALGIKLRSASKAVADAVRKLDSSQLAEFMSKGCITVCGHELVEGDIRLMHSFSGEKAEELSKKYEAHSAGEVLILLDITRNQDMVDEGTAREVINRIQKLRKKAHLVPSDPVSVYVSVSPPTDSLNNVIKNFQEFIVNTIKVPVGFLPYPPDKKVIIQETSDIKGVQLEMVIVSSEDIKHEKTLNAVHKNKQHFSPEDVRKKLKTAHISSEPFCRFVNVELCELNGPSDVTTTSCSVLLENPKGHYLLSGEGLSRQVQVVFGIHGKKPVLYLNSDKTNPISTCTKEEIMNLHSKTLYAYFS